MELAAQVYVYAPFPRPLRARTHYETVGKTRSHRAPRTEGLAAHLSLLFRTGLIVQLVQLVDRLTLFLVV